MRTKTARCGVLLLALLCLGSIFPFAQVFATESAPPKTTVTRARLAIVPLKADLEPAADLLTASLSTRKSVELVERQQIKKILKELEQGRAQVKNQLRIGELLAADGLLFLDRSSKGGKELLSLTWWRLNPA